MEQNYNEQEIAEHYIGIIKSKREQGFTDEQIAKDIGFPTEVVARCDTSCSEGPTHPGFSDLPDNPAEDDTELPMEDNKLDNDKENEWNSDSNNSEEKIEVKEEYTLEQSAEDMFSDDDFKQLKAEFAQAKNRHSKLIAHIAAVMAGKEESFMPVEMLQIKADALQTYLTVLGVHMNIVKNIEKDIKEKDENGRE